MNLNFKLTDNFTLSEFLISDFFDQRIQPKVLKEFKENIDLHFNIQKLAIQLQVLREELKCPIIINISYRPVFWEHLRGRSGDSKHTLCMAADIVAENFCPEEVADKIEELITNNQMSEGGLGRYNTFTHYDIRGTKARWND
jgi:uncharacterized protein YcbK (DUF882 family)